MRRSFPPLTSCAGADQRPSFAASPSAWANRVSSNAARSCSRGRRSACVQTRLSSDSVAVTTDTHRAIDAVWRIESAKLIASLTRLVGDVGLAEDLAQD